ncbi:MAG: nucleoside deaminase [Planctomycetota bacterium]
MRMALAEAQIAGQDREVPVGAVIVHPERGLIARAHNLREGLNDATAHAELLAIGQACAALESWRLEETVLYSTLEPCAMCAGAILQARIPRVVYGARDPKAGAVESVVQLWRPGLFNHDVSWRGGVLDDECAAMLTQFFRDLR